jgi:hypothetical protein
MIYHVVLFKFSASEATSKKIDGLYTAFKVLKDIPGVISVDYGNTEKAPYKSYLPRHKDYTHALLVVLKNWSALEDYEHHSTHQLIRNSFIKPLLDANAPDNVLALDFEGNFNKKYGIYRFLPEMNTVIFTGALATLTIAAGFFLRRKLLN